jgi:hypothetical protein
MLRNRILTVLGGFFLLASAAMADEVGYVDCSNHSEDAQVFAKPRRTPETIGSIPCGERFTIIVYGFVFSRVQTKDGNIGFIYSSLIAVDHNATAAIQTGTVRTASTVTKVPSTRPASPAPASSQQVDASAPPPPKASTASATPSTAQVPSTASAPASSAAEINLTASSPAQSAPSASMQSSSVSPVQTPTPAASPAPVTATPEVTITAAPPTPSATQPDALAQTASAQPPATVAAAPTAVSASSNPEPSPAPAAAQPNPPAPQPEPAAPAAEPVTPPVRPATPTDRAPWERPVPSVRTSPLIELYGGFAFNRMQGTGGSASSNFNGALGSFGWNFRSWLQLVADSSYNFENSSGTKYVLYGNHYGPRFFYRTRNRWGLTPFAEGFVGASRFDTTVSGSGGYTSSVNGISYKAGGGIDIHPTRHFDIRLFDVDYYRTSFGTNLHQTNYWISSGIVLRLFGGGSE